MKSQEKLFKSMTTVTVEKYKAVKSKLREVLEENEFLITQLWKLKMELMSIEKERDHALQRLTRGSAPRLRTQPRSLMDISDSDDDIIPARPPAPAPASSTAEKDKSSKRGTATSGDRKRKPVISKTIRIQPYPTDPATGGPILPLTAGAITVLALGEIVHDRPAFHSERYIYPLGYKAVKVYHSMVDATRTVNYSCEVMDGGEGPRFVVTPEDCPERSVSAISTTGAWTPILKAANELRSKVFTSGLSGPEQFGFTQGIVIKIIQELPNARLCKNYVWQEFEFIQARKRAVKTEDGAIKKAKGSGGASVSLTESQSSSYTSLDQGVAAPVSASILPHPLSTQPDYDDDDLDAEDEREDDMDEEESPPRPTPLPVFHGQYNQTERAADYSSPLHEQAHHQGLVATGGQYQLPSLAFGTHQQLASDQSSQYDST
ncbi:F/Y-rich N-terminus-domain-containing protein [Chytriomyces sp. MP71]|nr:F/Y-rich N-terminus-domain-containing protein [Chytriomyces sp. MP71]